MGPKGTMPLLPYMFYVAYQPRVEILVSETQLEIIRSDLRKSGNIGFFVAGHSFKNFNVSPLNDNGEAGNSDEVFWEEVESEELKPEEEEAVSTTENDQQEETTTKSDFINIAPIYIPRLPQKQHHQIFMFVFCKNASF